MLPCWKYLFHTLDTNIVINTNNFALFDHDMLSFQYKIIVRTGDRPKAGTDSHVFIKLHGDNGNRSDFTELDWFERDDFERGQEDDFFIRGMSVST